MLEPRYDHNESEKKIYELWEKSGYFNPDRLPAVGADRHRPSTNQHGKSQRWSVSSPRKSAFCVIMPPPNANGSLHIGHAVFVALQDIMIRYSRLRGKKTLWLPGADHAGFETQVVFEKKLEKEGTSRFAILQEPNGREKLYNMIYEFTQKNKRVMEDQLRRLGASCDWSREIFTLDPRIIKIVYETFEQLYRDSLVYRAERIVNFCTKHQTSLSDLEVAWEKRTDKLYFVKYAIVGRKNEFITVATTRPETIPGDTAIAVNPKDKRYESYVKNDDRFINPITGRAIPIVTDEAVDMNFGTGALKITPAHDAADFEIGKRHNLPSVATLEKNGRFNEKAGPFAGMKVAEAREKAVEVLSAGGALLKTEDYEHQVGVCYKCKNVLEPMVMSQWFVDLTKKGKKKIVEPAIKAVKSGKIKIIPDYQKKIFFHWLQNIRDWNISRQIVWGIRIPAWYCLGCGNIKINPQIKSRWFIVRHGETDWNREKRFMGHSGVSLNEIGKQQARDAAEALAKEDIDLIISSDLARCRETATIISQITGAKIIYDPSLRERHHGDLEGKLREGAEALCGDIYSYDKRVANGESYQDVEARTWRAFASHKIKHGHKNVVIVSHGGAIRMLLKQIRNLTPENAMSHPAIKNTEVVSMDIPTKPCEKCGGDLYERDPDVFDTWFSSGQWPYATLSATSDKRQATRKNNFAEFYPTSVMETGADILFFWVARMIMLGIYKTGKIPFETVYLHGLVRDKDRQKMSKSKGNVIDPLGVADLYGADALRMALVAGNTPGSDIIISEEKIKGYRNFATKLWNIARFVLAHEAADQPKLDFSSLDKKNLKNLKKIKTRIARHLDKFQFHLAAETIYHYIWHEFADKIIETYKSRLRAENSATDQAHLPLPEATADGGQAAAYQTLETILLECLKMLHPFMPFVTEEIYQKFRPGRMLMVEPW